ncbi:hypothetical protein LINPERPRIM_LOCUS29483 [Linum perenne]
MILLAMSMEQRTRRSARLSLEESIPATLSGIARINLF